MSNQSKGDDLLNFNECNKIEIKKLLLYYDDDFVQNTYRCLLKRRPDNNGLLYYLNRVRSGISRTEVIIQIHDSLEARAVGVCLQGVNAARVKLYLIKIPIIGTLVCSLIFLTRTKSLFNDARALHNHVYRISKSVSKQ